MWDKKVHTFPLLCFLVGKKHNVSLFMLVVLPWKTSEALEQDQLCPSLILRTIVVTCACGYANLARWHRHGCVTYEDFAAVSCSWQHHFHGWLQASCEHYSYGWFFNNPTQTSFFSSILPFLRIIDHNSDLLVSKWTPKEDPARNLVYAFSLYLLPNFSSSSPRNTKVVSRWKR